MKLRQAVEMIRVTLFLAAPVFVTGCAAPMIMAVAYSAGIGAAGAGAISLTDGGKNFSFEPPLPTEYKIQNELSEIEVLAISPDSAYAVGITEFLQNSSEFTIITPSEVQAKTKSSDKTSSAQPAFLNNAYHGLPVAGYGSSDIRTDSEMKKLRLRQAKSCGADAILVVSRNMGQTKPTFTGAMKIIYPCEVKLYSDKLSDKVWSTKITYTATHRWKRPEQEKLDKAFVETIAGSVMKMCSQADNSLADK